DPAPLFACITILLILAFTPILEMLIGLPWGFVF
ncbi:MAG: hypothetical protein ACI9WC_003917, partial [Arenicella sp.]